MNSPILQLILIGLVAYIFRLWWSDFKAAEHGQAKAGALPGAVACSKKIIIIGLTGAVLLVLGETLGEYQLGVSSEQSSVTWLFGAVTIASGFGEELIFRGYLIVQNRGKFVLWISIVGFSTLFALAHPFFWTWTDGVLTFELSPKAYFSSAIVFLNSLWFYGLRFNLGNPRKSLWPCIVAHTGSNAAVFVIKFFQGHVNGLY